MQKMTQRQQFLQQQHRDELDTMHSGRGKDNVVESFFGADPDKNTAVDLNRYANKQQREMARLIRLEKQRALDEVNLERQRLKMLEKQLNAQLIRLKQERMDFNKTKVKFIIPFFFIFALKKRFFRYLCTFFVYILFIFRHVEALAVAAAEVQVKIV